MFRYNSRKRTNESPQPFPMTAEEARVFDHLIAGGMWEPSWISRPILAEMVQNERKNRAAEVRVKN